MSTESFETASSDVEAGANASFALSLTAPMSTLRIDNSADAWCPQRYRADILDWLNDADWRLQLSFFYYIGATTRYAHPYGAKQMIQNNVDAKGIRQEYNRVQERLTAPFNRHSINALRLSTAFADMAFAFQSMFCTNETVTLSLFKRADKFTMPAVLEWAQSLQLDLDEEMQGYADQYARHHWLANTQNESEVPGCGHFLSKYHILCRDNHFLLYFPPGIFSTSAKSTATPLFKPPYSFEKLVAYQRLLAAFNVRGSKLDSDDVHKAFEDIDRSGLTPLETIASTFEDERRDGLEPRIDSKSVEYRAAKIGALRMREARDARRTDGPWRRAEPGRQVDRLFPWY